MRGAPAAGVGEADVVESDGGSGDDTRSADGSLVAPEREAAEGAPGR